MYRNFISPYKSIFGPDGTCFLAAWAVSKSVLGVKHDRPKSNLLKWKSIHPFRCSTSVFRAGQSLEKTALFRTHCQQVPKTHYSSAQDQRPHCNQDECFFVTLLCSLRHSSSFYRRPTALIQTS